MPSKKKPLVKWSRAGPLKRPDTMKSSIFTERGESGFIPSYEQGRPNLFFLLSNEYLRMWMKERDIYAKETYSVQDNTFNISMQRRFVQRNTKHTEKKKILPIIQLKRFENVPGKVETKRAGPTRPNPFMEYIRQAEEEKKAQFIRYKTTADCKPEITSPTTVKKSDSSERCCDIPLKDVV